MRAFTALLLATLSLPPIPASAQAARSDTATAEDLLGAWVGSATHRGESAPLAIELKPAEDGKLAVEMSIPAIHWSRRPVGVMPVEIEGDRVTIGPFAFVLDRDAGTLSGTLPAALVPVHQVPVVLRRTERIDFPSRPLLDAPVVTPSRAWTYEGGAAFWGGTAFSNGVVYAGGEDGRLHAIEAGTGDRRWIFQAGGAIRTRPTVAGNDLFLHADDGFLYRLSAASGEEVWRVRLEAAPIVRLPGSDPGSKFDRYGSDATVEDDVVYVGTHEGRVLALDRTSGERVWEFVSGDAVLAAPAVHGGRVYFGSYDGHVYALDAGGGRLLWKHDTGAPVVSTPAVAGDRVVVGSRSYDLLGLDADTGAVAWDYYLWFSWVDSSPTVHDGVVYVGSSDAASVFAVDAASGREAWASDVGGRAWDQPAVTAERVYIGTVGNAREGTHRGGVVALDRMTGRIAWRFLSEPTETGPYGFASSPAIGAGMVFVAGLDGRVYAFPG